MTSVVARLFSVKDGRSPLIVPAPAIGSPTLQLEIETALSAGKTVIVYLQDKLGGEISIPSTDRSPELAIDITLAEIKRRGGEYCVERFGILEVQTMDYHGTYRNVVQNLKDALRLHRRKFPTMVGANTDWLSERMEGPNIANVFKHTFYQMILKFQIATHPPLRGWRVSVACLSVGELATTSRQTEAPTAQGRHILSRTSRRTTQTANQHLRIRNR